LRWSTAIEKVEKTYKESSSPVKIPLLKDKMKEIEKFGESEEAR